MYFLRFGIGGSSSSLKNVSSSVVKKQEINIIHNIYNQFEDSTFSIFVMHINTVWWCVM